MMDYNRVYYTDAKIVPEKDETHVLKLSKTKYRFKQVNRKEWEIMSTAAVLDYVSSKGFNEITFIKKNGDLKPYVKNGEGLYVFMSIADGEKLKLRNENNGLRLTELLARFHNAAEGFIQPPGIKIQVDWGKRMERYRMFTSRLEKYINYIENKEVLNEFEEYTLQYTETLIKRARAGMKILKSLSYLRSLESSMKRKEICINNISSNTAIINEDGVVISKIFEIGYNMAEEDIAALIKKLIIVTGDPGVFDRVMGKYCGIRELGEDSESIIKALVSYPSDSIKVILKYYNQTKDMTEGDSAYNLLMLEKLKKYIGKELLTDVLGG
ncbi:MAG: hypothetical protein K0R09_165 [Clostridiales bacterium]|jgi:CotS family spore coat protein|nr:hypothetical protein [Clostridiales bacterium]